LETAAAEHATYPLMPPGLAILSVYMPSLILDTFIADFQDTV
jgi:hypothetical protein